MTRPTVHIRPVKRGSGRTDHVVWCSTGECVFVYVASVKSDAQQQAMWHRDKHRGATA